MSHSMCGSGPGLVLPRRASQLQVDGGGMKCVKFKPFVHRKGCEDLTQGIFNDLGFNVWTGLQPHMSTESYVDPLPCARHDVRAGCIDEDDTF